MVAKMRLFQLNMIDYWPKISKKSHGKHFRYSEQPSGGHHVPYRSLLEAIDFLNNERNQ